MITEVLSLDQQSFTFIGKETAIKGEFIFSGIVKVAGQIEGQVEMAGKGQLTLERTGKLEGSVSGHHIEIFGRFKGNLYSTGKVVIWPSAEVLGKIEAKSLVIYPGATLNIEGHTEVREENQSNSL